MFIQRRIDPLPWDPWFRGFDQLFSDQDRSYRAPVRSEVTEEDEYFALRVELPGFTEKDVRVDFDAGVLAISAERKSEAKEGEAPAPAPAKVRSERRLTKSFEVGDAVDPEKITAEMHAGVLTVKLPKHTRVKARQIAVRAA